jgi:hypothetical protein
MLEWDIGLQEITCRNTKSLCHSDMDVQPYFHEQLATSSWWQSVANWAKKPQLQDLFITQSIISIGDEHSGPIFIDRNLT